MGEEGGNAPPSGEWPSIGGLGTESVFRVGVASIDKNGFFCDFLACDGKDDCGIIFALEDGTVPKSIGSTFLVLEIFRTYPFVD